MPPSPNPNTLSSKADAEALPNSSSSTPEISNKSQSETTTNLRSKPAEHEILTRTTPQVQQKREPVRIVWRNVGIFVFLHFIALNGLYKILSGQMMLPTFLLGALFYAFSVIGVGAGCHRLWSHKSYKAKLPLRIILAAFQTIAFQNHIYEWSRDHRVHHKYSETQADPHDATRGFFFAHVGWLLCRKSKAVKQKGAGLDLTDLKSDPVVMFQKRHYLPLGLTLAFGLPIILPIILWGETYTNAFHMTMFRYIMMLHVTWCVNSVAHMFGDRPYDKTINPVQVKLLSVFAFGEGWHNYHHVFPWDYKTAELGIYRYNLNTAFIDAFAKIGWAYDLKSVPNHIVMARVNKTGDGSYLDGHQTKDIPIKGGDANLAQKNIEISAGPWGFGDPDIPKEYIKLTETLYPLDK